MYLRLLFTSVLLFAAFTYSFAQRPGGGGTTGGSSGSTGPNTPSFSPNMPSGSQASELQVRIAWPNERQVEDPVHIQLLNSQNVPVQDTFSNHDGMVTFHNVYPGTYRFKMDGSEIKDSTTDAFVIYPNDHMHMEWVHVVPKENGQKASAPGTAPTISASDLNAPPKAKSEMDKGMEAFSKGDMKKAAERLQKAVEIYPKYARAWVNLGVVRMRENDRQGAREAWKKAIEADDKFPSSYLNLARLDIIEKNLPEADSYLKKALSFDPNNAEGLVLLAKVQLLNGEYDKSLLNARKVHTMPHEHLADAHLIAGEDLLHQNHSAEAVQEYELYLKEYPDSPNAAAVRKAMAQIQAKQQKPEAN